MDASWSKNKFVIPRRKAKDLVMMLTETGKCVSLRSYMDLVLTGTEKPLSEEDVKKRQKPDNNLKT